MMNCEHIQTLLPEFARGNLAAEEQDLTANHLKQCPGCRLEFETELEFMVALGGLPLVECPTEVTDGILLQIQQDEKQIRKERRNWMFGASTLVAAGLALILLLPSADPVPPTETFSSSEINQATKEAQWALAKVVTVINRNENNAFEQVFGQEIPGAVGGSLRHITKNLQGEV